MKNIPNLYSKTSYTKEMRVVIHDKFKTMTKKKKKNPFNYLCKFYKFSES